MTNSIEFPPGNAVTRAVNRLTSASQEQVRDYALAAKHLSQALGGAAASSAQGPEQLSASTQAPYTRQEFAAQLNKVHPGIFTSAEDITSTLASMGIEVDPALASAIFATSKSQVNTPQSPTKFTEGVRTSTIESLIFDAGSVSAAGQTTPGALGLVANTGGDLSPGASVAPLRLELDENASAFDKLRFGWTGSANASTVISRLQTAGYGEDAPSDKSSTLTLSQGDQDAIEWLVKTRGYRDPSASTGTVLSWDEISNLATLGVLNLEPGASTQEGVVDMDAAIHLALAGGSYGRRLPPLGDLQSNPAVVDGAYEAPFFDDVFADDNRFTQELQKRHTGLTIDPTQLGLYRSTNPSDATTGPGALSVQQLDAAISAGTYQYSVSDDGRVLVTLADPNAVLKDAIAAAPLLANGQSVNAEQLVSVVNRLTGTQVGNLSREETQFLVTQFGDASTGRITASQLKSAVDAGALQATVDPADNSIEIVVSETAPPELNTDPGTIFTGSVGIAAVGLRTPIFGDGAKGLDAVWAKHLLPGGAAAMRLDDFARAYGADSEGFTCGAFKFRASNALTPGKFNLEMAVAGSEDTWVTVFTGAGDSSINAKQTYEWDVGVAGEASVNSSDGDPTAVAGPYTRLKLNRTFQIFETDPPGAAPTNKLDKNEFRSRTYFPAPVGTVAVDVNGVVNGDYVPPVSAEYWADVRWGKISGKPSATTPQRLVEWGLRFNLGVNGLEDIVASAATGDWSGVATAAKAAPALGVALNFWTTGLFEVQAAAKAVHDKLLRQPDPETDGLITGNSNPRWHKTVPANVVNYIGETLQHWVVNLNAGVQVSGVPNGTPQSTGPAQASRSTLETQQATASTGGVPAVFSQLFGGIEAPSGLGPLQDVFDALENFDVGPLATVAQGASTAIAAFSAAKEFVQAFQSRGASAFKNLDENGKAKLLDLVMEEATRLMLEKSNMGPPSLDAATTVSTAPNAEQQQNSLLIQPGETPAQYAARLSENIAANIGQAVKNVMLKEQTWNELDPDWKKPPNQGSGDGGGNSGGGGGGIGAGGIGGIGSGIGGAIGAIAGGIAAIAGLLAAGSNGSEGSSGSSGSNGPISRTFLTLAQGALTNASNLLQTYQDGGSVTAQQVDAALGLIVVARLGLPMSQVGRTPEGAEIVSALNTAQTALLQVRNNLNGPQDSNTADLNTATSRFGVSLVQDALDAGFSLSEILTAQSREDLQRVLNLLDEAHLVSDPKLTAGPGIGLESGGGSRQELLDVMKGKLQDGWTLSDIAKLESLSEWPVTDALAALTRDEIRNQNFLFRFWEATEYLQQVVEAPPGTGILERPDISEVAIFGVMSARYFPVTTDAELHRPNFLRALYESEQALPGSSPEKIVERARRTEVKF